MIGRTMTRALRAEGYAIDWTRDGEAALSALTGRAYDLMLLDLGLPRRDGLAVLRSVRGAGRDLPVLIITARDAIEDRVTGLDAGADDYLAKPFDLDELLARIRALLRRSQGRADPKLRHGSVELDPARREVTLNGAAVTLSAKEFELLHVLMGCAGRVLSRDQLLEKLYGWNDDIGSNTIEVYVHGLRRKLGAGLIQTLRGSAIDSRRRAPTRELDPAQAVGNAARCHRATAARRRCCGLL